MSSLRVAVVMDPIAHIKPHKDTTFAMMLEAQRRGWPLLYLEMADLSLRGGELWGRWRTVRVKDNNDDWFSFDGQGHAPLAQVADVILMRKDPPFDMDYVYATYLLEHAQRAGVPVVNSPRGLREVNEKLYTAWFPQCCPPTWVSASRAELLEFIGHHQDVIIKPLDLMGGASIYRLRPGDPNLNVILETMTQFDTRLVMAQRYLPQISEGDKRVLLIDGEPVPYALARIPKAGETRGNLAAGGRGVGVPLTERDRWICAQVAPKLRELGLLFVGLDIIGDSLTEINVTSPTCARELDAQFELNIAGQLFDAIVTQWGQK